LDQFIWSQLEKVAELKNQKIASKLLLDSMPRPERARGDVERKQEGRKFSCAAGKGSNLGPMMLLLTDGFMVGNEKAAGQTNT